MSRLRGERATAAWAIALVLSLTLASGILPGRASADEMLSVCTPEIADHCGGVAEGRGRILACLLGYRDSLGGSCAGQVEEAAEASSRNRLVPAGARRMLAAQTEAAAPEACSGDAASLSTAEQK